VKALCRPIAVDLDGTLIREESPAFLLGCLFRKNPFKALKALPIFLTQGSVALKEFLAAASDVFPKSWTWNEALLTHLKTLKDNGHSLILITGAPQDFAKAMTTSLGLFDAIWGSSQGCNLVGSAKSRKLCHHFGKQGFIYIGNSLQDIPVWKNAREAWAVRPSFFVRLALKRLTIPVKVFP
jgi:phosphoserine phosphatase